MKRSGIADLPLHRGRVPQWLAERMTRMGTAITEAIVRDYGTAGFLSRLSDPFWFQALGAVMGMDWHSSGIYNIGHGRSKARTCGTRKRTRYLCLRRARPVLSKHTAGIAVGCGAWWFRWRRLGSHQQAYGTYRQQCDCRRISDLSP